MHGASTLPIGSIYGIPEDYHLLTQNMRAVKGRTFCYVCCDFTEIASDLGSGKSVAELALDLVGERIIACPAGMLAVPSRPHESVEWDSPHVPAGELRALVDKRVR